MNVDSDKVLYALTLSPEWEKTLDDSCQMPDRNDLDIARNALINVFDIFYHKLKNNNPECKPHIKKMIILQYR